MGCRWTRCVSSCSCPAPLQLLSPPLSGPLPSPPPRTTTPFSLLLPAGRPTSRSPPVTLASQLQLFNLARSTRNTFCPVALALAAFDPLQATANVHCDASGTLQAVKRFTPSGDAGSECYYTCVSNFNCDGTSLTPQGDSEGITGMTTTNCVYERL